jgi:hypothetical protein
MHRTREALAQASSEGDLMAPPHPARIRRKLPKCNGLVGQSHSASGGLDWRVISEAVLARQLRIKFILPATL